MIGISIVIDRISINSSWYLLAYNIKILIVNTINLVENLQYVGIIHIFTKDLSLDIGPVSSY